MDLNKLKSEGDINISPARTSFNQKNINDDTQYWLNEDSKYFLHQSLSTPCLNVLEKCQGSKITDLEGRAYYDFHGNNVHQVGFSNPKVIEAIIQQMQELSFC